MRCSYSLRLRCKAQPCLKLLEGGGLPQLHLSGFHQRNASFSSHRSSHGRILIIRDSLEHKNLRTKGENTDLKEKNGKLNAWQDRSSKEDKGVQVWEVEGPLLPDRLCECRKERDQHGCSSVKGFVRDVFNTVLFFGQMEGGLSRLEKEKFI